MLFTSTGHGATKTRRKTNSVSLCLGGALAAMVVALWVPIGMAQQQAQPPTFRAATKLIVTTVVVRNPDGTPVEGLTADDFIVTEDNEPQEIAFVEYQRLDNLDPLPPMDTLQVTNAARPSAVEVSSIVAGGITVPPSGDGRFRNRRLIILFFERIAPKPRWFDGDKLPLSKAFQIGCCQVLAIIPGVSRSGATILGGELLGVDRRAATLFTFYLAVPTMLGASILELHHKAGELSRGQGLNIVIGFVVSFVVAFFVIRGFLQIVTKYGLKPFGWYRIAAGLALAVYLFIH